MRRVALKGPVVAARPRRADRVRGRARRRDGQRHVHPHRHHQQGVRHDLPGLLLEHERGHLRARGGQGRRQRQPPPCPPRCSIACAPMARSPRRQAPSSTSTTRPTTKLIGKDGQPLGSSNNGRFGFGFAPNAERFNPMTLTAGQLGIRPGAGRHRQGHRQGQRLRRGRPDRHRRPRSRAAVHVTGIARYGTVNSIGGATIAVFDVPTAQALLGKRGQYDTIFAAAKDGVSSDAAGRRPAAAGAGGRAGQDRPGAGRLRLEGHAIQQQLRQVLPARLRLHRARRGRVRDLQHALDHARPAHPRARDAAHPRRVADARSSARC